MKKVNRETYLKSLVDARENSMIKVITGIRRCGKSYLLNTLFYDLFFQDPFCLSHSSETEIVSDQTEKTADHVITLITKNPGKPIGSPG